MKNSYQLAVASTGLVVSTRRNGASRYFEYRENHGAEKNKLRKLKFVKNRISKAALLLVSIMLQKFDPPEVAILGADQRERGRQR